MLSELSVCWNVTVDDGWRCVVWSHVYKGADEWHGECRQFSAAVSAATSCRSTTSTWPAGQPLLRQYQGRSHADQTCVHQHAAVLTPDYYYELLFNWMCFLELLWIATPAPVLVVVSQVSQGRLIVLLHMFWNRTFRDNRYGFFPLPSQQCQRTEWHGVQAGRMTHWMLFCLDALRGLSRERMTDLPCARGSLMPENLWGEWSR